MMGSACAYQLDRPSQAACADEQSRPTCTFGTIFMSIMDKACVSPSELLNQPPHCWYQTYAQFLPSITFFLWHGLASSTQRTYNQHSLIDFLSLNPYLLNTDGSFLPASKKA